MRGLVLRTGSALCAIANAAFAAPSGELMRVGAYIPEYRFGLDWGSAGSRATDLILFSVEPAADGTVAELGRLTTDALNAAREARETHGTRLHVCIGGAGRSANFGPVAKNPELRKKFGMALLALAQVEKLDGLDFDWEAQIGNEKNFAKLIRGIKKAARKRLPELTVSVAVHPGQFWVQTFKEADFIHLMSYDSCPGAPCRHATLDSAKEHVGAMLKAGVPASKLLLGIPAYAREMHHPQEVKTYEEIHRLGTEAAVTLTEDADELAIEGGGEWWFNGPSTVKAKTHFAASEGLGGVFFWEGGQDAPDASASLMAAARAAAEEAATGFAEARTKADL